MHLARSEGKEAFWTTLERELDWTSSDSCSSTTERRRLGRFCSVCARHEKCFFTKYIQQICCPANLSKCCKINNYLMAFGQTCWTKTGRLLKRWKDERGKSSMRNVSVNKFEENASESNRRQLTLQLKSNQTRTCSRFRKRRIARHGGDFIHNRN